MAIQSRFTNVAVLNRGDFPLSGIQYDGEEIEWAPREVKHLIAEVAQHCIRHSARKWDPVTHETLQVLCELKPGVDPDTVPVLTYDEAHPDQLLVTDNLPDTHFDDEGRPIPRGELKRLAPPTAMMRGRIPGAAGAGLAHASRGAAGTGLGAAEPMPNEIAARLAAHTETLIDRAAEIVPQEA